MDNYKRYAEEVVKAAANYKGYNYKEPSIQNTYIVQKGDTLWTISQRYLGSGYKYKEIKDLNALNSDMIYAGQNLKIPK